MLAWEAIVQRTQRRPRLGLAVEENSNSTNTIELRKKTMSLVEDVTVVEMTENREPMIGKDFTYLVQN